MPEFFKAAGKHRRDRLPVARAHSHHRRAAKAQNADCLCVASSTAGGVPKPLVADGQVFARDRTLPPFDIRSPLDPYGAVELAEISFRPVSAAVCVGRRTAIGTGRLSITQPSARAAPGFEPEL